MLDELDPDGSVAVRRPVLSAGRRRPAGRDGAAAGGRAAEPLRHDLLPGWPTKATKDAMPGLAEAIAKGRFLPPNSRGHYRLHWLAALSIAARDPWPAADAWLAGQIGQTELLIEPMPSSLALREPVGRGHGGPDESADRGSGVRGGGGRHGGRLVAEAPRSIARPIRPATGPRRPVGPTARRGLPLQQRRRRGRRCSSGGKTRRGRNPSPIGPRKSNAPSVQRPTVRRPCSAASRRGHRREAVVGGC